MLSIIFSTILAVAAAESNIKDPINNFCRRHKHQTCTIDSKLYIDGGLVYYGGGVNNDSVAEQNTWLLWEDTSDTNNEYNFPVQRTGLTKDTNIPSVSGGVLWPDTVNKLFYLFGGEYYETKDIPVGDAQGFTLWFFDTVYNTWNRSTSDGSQATVKWPALGAGTVTDEGVAYYYGGYLTNRSDIGWSDERFMLNNLISYDMETRRWDNNTWDETPRAEGSLHYVPASERGMLVYFGGVETNSTDGQVNYLWPTPQQYLFPGGKGWSSCDVVRESQMIIMGGYLTNTSKPDCDVPAIGGQHGLLLGQENEELNNWWHAPMDNTTGYRVPDQIVASIGGDADGHATATAPAKGWEATDLAVRRNQNNQGINLPQPSQTPDFNSPEMAQKSVADVSLSQGSTLHSPLPQSPMYSPQGSPRPPSNPWHRDRNISNSYYQVSPPSQAYTGEWSQQGGYSYQQAYFPPPPEPSQSPKAHNAQEMSVELPDIRSPANAELPQMRSPVAVRGFQ
ncbi:hypothetical protein N0V90_008680 [Kalmusia sp. IMI 367209]|nr:hypothetical protein N0V90_008680 [Kalmusia sp. IMI 367209]